MLRSSPIRIAIKAIGAVTAMVLAIGATGSLAAGPADGTYRGDSSITVGPPSTCGKNVKTSVKVVDGHFDYTWDKEPLVLIPVTIAADGSVSGERFVGKNAGASAKGRLTGNNLEVDFVGKVCTRHLSLKKGAPSM